MFMTYQEALQNNIPCKTPPPDEVVACEFCGKELHYHCVVIPGQVQTAPRFFPELCFCKQAKAKRRQEEEDSLNELIAKARNEDKTSGMKRLITDSGVKGIYQNATFDKFQVSSGEQRMAKTTIMEYAAEFPKFYQNPDEIKKGLFLHGTVGTGKTLLVSALCNALTKQGIRCIFTTADNMLGEIKETFNGEGSEMAARNKFKDIPVLILDDLGKEKATEWYTSTLFDIIDARYSNGLVTIVTANHDTKSLEEILTPKGSKDQTKAKAIVSRLKGMSRNVIPMRWEDYRCKH
jgi:DNA replication protein DnaC